MYTRLQQQEILLMPTKHLLSHLLEKSLFAIFNRIASFDRALQIQRNSRV